MPALFATAINTIANAQYSIVRGFFIGETNVPLIEKRFNQHERSNALFINVHDNERTSVQALEAYFSNKSGLLLKLDNSQLRNLSFTLDGKQFTVDPNRIFTQQGRLATLKLLSNNASAAAEDELAFFAERLLAYVNAADIVIALHNNTDSNFSIITFQQQQQAKPGSGKVFINDSADADDFILTTDTAIFNSLQQKRINAVWEDVSMIEDDGSLSVYAALHHIIYINIEAEHGHYYQQLTMLNGISEFISNKSTDTESKKNSRREYLYAPDK